MKRLPLLPLALTAGIVLFLFSKHNKAAASSNVINSVNPDGSFSPPDSLNQPGFTPPDVNLFKNPTIQPITANVTTASELLARKIHGG